MSSSTPSSPDVLVLGMPSSGKTVFLSVLGRDFTLVADDSDARPLGFRMRAIGRSTLETVSRNYAKLLGGEWPASTVAGSFTPLTWDVFTGARKVFTLSSMDISGESFVSAFSEGGKAASRKSDDDGLLDVAENETTMSDTASALLREQAASAKVICFFVNIAAARRGALGGGAKYGQKDFDAIRNYEDGIANMCVLLDEFPELRSKALVVLTQAHRHQAEIEKAGGPAAYLGRIAPNLRQSVAEFSIPVIAVSAINERDSGLDFDDDDDGDNAVPETLESDGLFGFLLVVAGMIPDARLSHVKDCYLRYLADKSRSLQLSCRSILERLPLIEAYAESGSAFVKACSDYLGDPENVNQPGGARLSQSAIDLYRRCTMSDKDVVLADSAWKRRLAIDRAWDRVFRRIVLEETRRAADETSAAGAAAAPSAQQIVDAVKAELGSEAGDPAGLTFAALYGFEREDLDPTRDASNESAWVLKCLDEYRHRMASDLESYMVLFAQTRQRLAEVDPEQDGEFKLGMDAVVDGVSRCWARSAVFREEWLFDGGVLLQLDSLERELKTIEAGVDDVEARHSRWLDAMEVARQKRTAAEAKARQLAYEAEEAERRRRRRNQMIAVAACLALLASILAVVFFVQRSARVRENASHWVAANAAFERGDLSEAQRQLDAVADDPRFFVRRSDAGEGFARFESKVNLAIQEELRLKQLETNVAIAQTRLDELRKGAVEKEAEEYAKEELADADTKRVAAGELYADGSIDAQALLERLDEIRRLYEYARNVAVSKVAHRERQIAEAQAKYGKALSEAEFVGDGRFAVDAIAEAKGERDNLERARSSIGLELYLKRLGDIEAKLRDAKDLAEREKEAHAKAEAARQAKQAEERRRVAEAKDSCDRVRGNAVVNGAIQFANKDLDAADKSKKDADSRYLDGSLSVDQYVAALKAAEARYEAVSDAAVRNAKPKVRLFAKRADNGAQVAATVTRGLATPTETKVSGGLDVSIADDSIGKAVEFEAQFTAEDGVKYVGKVSVTARKGSQDATIFLVPEFTLPSDINFCGGCRYSLKEHRHVRYCPNCRRDLTKFKVAR